MQFKNLLRFRLVSLLSLIAVVAVWIAATIRPIQYLRNADRIRELAARVANRSIDSDATLIPWRTYCYIADKDSDLPSILVIDKRCPASMPVMEIAGRIPTLTTLDLTRSDVSDTSFVKLSPLRCVRHLRVQGRPITDPASRLLHVGVTCNLPHSTERKLLIRALQHSLLVRTCANYHFVALK